MHWPFTHAFVVQAKPSSQSAVEQHLRQPTPAQQCVPAPQPVIWHFPAAQLLVVQGSPSSQLAFVVHWMVGAQPLSGLHV